MAITITEEEEEKEGTPGFRKRNKCLFMLCICVRIRYVVSVYPRVYTVHSCRIVERTCRT